MNPDFARKILAWQHSGFSIESGTRILDQSTREALCQYIVSAPLSLQRIRWDEQQDTVTWSASPPGFFKGRIRRYSSRGRGTWKHHLALRSRAPTNWYGRNATADPALPDAPKDRGVDALSRRKAWARLLAKVHELDGMACPRCGSRMAVIAVITDPAQIRKIIAYLDRHGRDHLPLGGALRRRGDNQTAPPLTSSCATPTAVACPPRHTPGSCGCRRGFPIG